MQAQSNPTLTKPIPASAPKRVLPKAEIIACTSYRDACRLAWKNRTRQNMTQQTLAEECGLYAPHVSQYLNAESHDKNGNKRQELPPDKIDLFEACVGNGAPTQYLTRKSDFTLMEEHIAERRGL